MKYLVALRAFSQGKPEIATIVVDLPEDYDFSQDIHEPSHTGHFSSLKKICHDQCPSGFHEANWMLNKSDIEHTKVIAVSKLG